MTRHEKRLAEAILGRIERLSSPQMVEQLMALGLLNIRVCEQFALRDEVARLEQGGMLRCEALQSAAQTFSCSYEKARFIFYNQFKS